MGGDIENIGQITEDMGGDIENIDQKTGDTNDSDKKSKGSQSEDY